MSALRFSIRIARFMPLIPGDAIAPAMTRVRERPAFPRVGPAASIHLQVFDHRPAALCQRDGQVVTHKSHFQHSLCRCAFPLIQGLGTQTASSVGKSSKQKFLVAHRTSLQPRRQARLVSPCRTDIGMELISDVQKSFARGAND